MSRLVVVFAVAFGCGATATATPPKAAQEFTGHLTGSISAGFSPDGKLFASQAAAIEVGGSKVLVWDIATGKQTHKFPLAHGFAFDSTGDRLAEPGAPLDTDVVNCVPVRPATSWSQTTASKGARTMSALVLLAGLAIHSEDEVRLNEPAGYLGIAPAVDRDKPTVESVAENSPAANAGLKVGDVITKLDGMDVRTLAEFTSAMQKRKAGDEVILTLLRGRDTIEVKAKLIARPKPK